MRARYQPGKGSIPISIPISISTMIWLIDNPSYSTRRIVVYVNVYRFAVYVYVYVFGPSLSAPFRAPTSPGSQSPWRPWRPWRLGGSFYGVGHCRMNCLLGFDSVSGVGEGRGIQPPRRQERQGERWTLRWDMSCAVWIDA